MCHQLVTKAERFPPPRPVSTLVNVDPRRVEPFVDIQASEAVGASLRGCPTSATPLIARLALAVRGRPSTRAEIEPLGAIGRIASDFGGVAMPAFPIGKNNPAAGTKVV